MFLGVSARPVAGDEHPITAQVPMLAQRGLCIIQCLGDASSDEKSFSERSKISHKGKFGNTTPQGHCLERRKIVDSWGLLSCTLRVKLITSEGRPTLSRPRRPAGLWHLAIARLCPSVITLFASAM